MNGEQPSAIDGLSPQQQQRLAEILDAYLSDLEQGRQPDLERHVADHPELAGALQSCLGSLRFLQQAAADFGPSAPQEPPALSERRLGDYELEGEVGRGGMGVVYRARQSSLDRPVALKILPLAGLLDQRQIARFQKEARAAAQLHHPHIVPIYAVGCERGIHYYAMQFIEGQPLDRVIAELRHQRRLPGGRSGSRPSDFPTTLTASDAAAPATETPAGLSAVESTGSALGVSALAGSTAAGRALSTVGHAGGRAFFRRVAELGVQVAEALEHAHQYGIVHRDVKPSNLLLDERGEVWVTDFGLARFQADAELTATGSVLGTLRYMSPEQASGQTALVDPRTDVYALGITLYELLTLEVPFGDADRARLLRRIADEEPRSPRRIDPAIPRDLETIVLKAIAKVREQRYTTARELADDLQRFLAGQPTHARPPALAERAGKWLRRHPAVVGSSVAMLTICVLALGASTLLLMRERAKTTAALERAELHYRQARRAVDRFATQQAQQLAALPGAERLRQELLDDTLQYYQEFIAAAAHDPALHVDLALTHFRIGQIAQQLGDAVKAEEAYQQSAQRLQELVDRQPDRVDLGRDLALCHNNLGLLWARQGRSAAAEGAYNRAIDLQTAALRQAPAEEQAALEADLALSHGNRALLLAQGGRVAEADQAYHRAIEVQRQLAARQPDEPRHPAALAASYSNLSLLYARRDPVKAEVFCRDGLKLQQQLVAAHPAALGLAADLALSYNNLGALVCQNDRADQAHDCYREAIGLQERLVRTAPAVVQYRRDLAITYNNQGRVYTQQGRLTEAQKAFGEARRRAEDLVHDYPAELNYRSDLGGILNNLARVLEQLNQADEAIALYARAIEHQQRAYKQAPDVARYREFLSQQYGNYARVLRSRNREAEAVAATEAKERLGRGGDD